MEIEWNTNYFYINLRIYIFLIKQWDSEEKLKPNNQAIGKKDNPNLE